MPWKFDYAGETYRETDVTLGQMERIEQATERSWRFVAMLNDAKTALAMAATLVSDRTGRPYDEVRDELRNMRMMDFLESVVPVEDDLPTMYVDGNPPQAGA